RLILLSILVGVILAAIGLDPLNIIESVESLLEHIWNMGFDAVRWLWRYFLLGAVIVLPIWFLARLVKAPRGVLGAGQDRSAGRVAGRVLFQFRWAGLFVGMRAGRRSVIVAAGGMIHGVVARSAAAMPPAPPVQRKAILRPVITVRAVLPMRPAVAVLRLLL